MIICFFQFIYLLAYLFELSRCCLFQSLYLTQILIKLPEIIYSFIHSTFIRGSTIYASILQVIVTTQGKVYIEIVLNISYPYENRTRGLNLIQKAVFVLINKVKHFKKVP